MALEAHRLGLSKPGWQVSLADPGAHGLGAPGVPTAPRGGPPHPSSPRTPETTAAPGAPVVTPATPGRLAPASHAHPDTAMVAPRFPAPRRHFVPDGRKEPIPP